MAVTAPSLHPPEARPGTRPGGCLGFRLVELTQALHHDQYQLVITAAAFADSGEWAADGASSAGAWLADIEPATAREWIRIGRQLHQLPVIAADFAAGRLSYAKVRTLTRVATTDNETELAAGPNGPSIQSPDTRRRGPACRCVGPAAAPHHPSEEGGQRTRPGLCGLWPPRPVAL